MRVPYWLAGADRGEAGTAIRDVLDGDMAPCVDERSLRCVLTELAIAPVREQLWPAVAAVARHAAGHAPDVLPIRLCDTERRAVLALPGLSGTLRSALNDGLRQR